ncbi:TPA: hypothetical protein DCQ44_02560 [Candidatus Taylorbacteria bacterium]|nr:hypothetical protein [Candidatus Taylorbacteria bacterium]
MLPSKKILVVLALLIIGIGAFAWYGYNKSSNTFYANSGNNQNLLAIASSTDQNAAVSQKDSDNDGLPDWEEALYGTDPHNPDTDGDGTPDGAEIAAGRNPLIKGPKDVINKTPTAVVDSATSEKLTLTDTFARDFFQKYIALKQSGTVINPDNVDQVASDFLSSATLPTIDAKQYTSSDLNLTDSDKDNLLVYQGLMVDLYNKFWPGGQTSEASILQDAFTNNNASALTQLTPLISAYQSLLQNALTTPTPKLAVSLHLGIVNSLSTYIKTLKMIQLSFSDPLSGLVGLNAFETNQTNLAVSTTNLTVFLINSLK